MSSGGGASAAAPLPQRQKVVCPNDFHTSHAASSFAQTIGQVVTAIETKLDAMQQAQEDDGLIRRALSSNASTAQWPQVRYCQVYTVLLEVGCRAQPADGVFMSALCVLLIVAPVRLVFDMHMFSLTEGSL